MRYSKGPDQIGSKLGPKLVTLIAQTVAATKLRLLDTEHRARVHSMQTIIDRAGSEIADLYRPVFQEVIKDQDLPPEIREFVEKSISGTHQWHAIGGALFQASGASSAISMMLNNFLAPGVRFAVSKDPQILPSNEELIQAGVKGAMDWQDVYYYAHGQGYADLTIQSLAEAMYSYPDADTTFELLRRRLISGADARKFLTRNGIPGPLQDTILKLEQVPLSPADLADMVVRGIKPNAEAEQVAAESGVSAADFAAMVEDTGEPLALMQLLEAFRRGFIDTPRLQRGIKQSRIRDEWIDVATKLRYEPMSVADAVNAVVQNHIPASEGARYAELNGLEPGDFDILAQTAGEPLSRTEMEELYNRGLVSQAEVDQALRESRLKDKYVGDAFQLHRRIIPARTLHEALKNGAVTHDDAVRIAMESGYTKADAEIVVTAGSSDALSAYKGKTIAAIESMYEDNLLPQSEAQSLIEGQGYTATQADYILKAAEFRRMAHAVTQVVSAVKGKYLQHHITSQQATGFLDKAGIPTPQRDYLIGLWDIERDAYTRALTPAQIVKAVNKSLITPQDGLARLQALGYPESDANLLLKGA